MEPKKIILTVLAAVVVAAGAYLYWTKDTRKINKRFNTMIEKLEKTEAEADLERLTRTAIIAGTFANPVEITFGGEEYTVGQDQMKAGVHDLRGTAREIRLEIEHRELHYDRATREALLEIQGEVIIDGAGYRLPGSSLIRFHWKHDSDAGSWVIDRMDISSVP